MELLEKLPEQILSWQLRGAGLSRFGVDGKPETVPFPSYGEDDLIVRVDAVGLCFSDLKLISMGSAHPRIEGRDLKKDPVVPGHEVSLTVVGVGDGLKGRFRPGERCVLQADVFYGGKPMAFGYALRGGMSQYAVLGREILEGDEGCYLLPVKPQTSYVEAALVEPWTCVTAAYQIRARTENRENGVLYFHGFPEGQIPLKLEGLSSRKPSVVVHDGLSSANLEAVLELCRSMGVEAIGLDALSGARPSDIVCAGTPDGESFARLVELIDADGVLSVHAAGTDGELPVDIGKVHFKGLEITGSRDGAVLASYARNTREALKPGGRAWFVGGAGPMGQMHVIKAILDDRGPSTMLVTDLSDDRLDALKRLVGLIRPDGGRKIDLEFRNPSDLKGEELDAFLGESYPGGFDDIVALVPVAAIISQASRFLAPMGVLNVFAGVNPGTVAAMPLERIVDGRGRITGSSGSPLSAMKETLALTEAGKLAPALSLAAVGDMYSVAKGIKSLMDNTFPGKVVIFPFAHGIGLKSLRELGRDLPELAAKLLDGRYWTREAEKEFLSSKYFRS